LTDTEADPDRIWRGTYSELDRVINEASRPVKVTNDRTPEQSLKETTESIDKLRLKDHQLDHQLKKWLGFGAVGVLGLQMTITNVACVLYGVVIVKRGDPIPDAALVAWTSSTIVEIVALALVVTKYLFPESGNNWNHEPPRSFDNDD
jgi:hypothetical protein